MDDLNKVIGLDEWCQRAYEQQARRIKAEAERDRYKEALEEIKRRGRVCAEFEVCDHPACDDSYAAYAIAEEVLSARQLEETPE